VNERSPPRFDLTDEPWVPVEDLTGLVREVGLAEVFARAAELRRVVDASPLVTVALYRLLFAIFHRAVPFVGDNEWLDAWEVATAHTEVGAYLATWRHRFDLFDPVAPFWQVADLDETHGTMAWTKLAAELNDNNSKVLFDHTATGRAPVASPARVARLLVACQVMSVGAGKSAVGYNVHAPTATALVVVPEGPTLADTLLANVRTGSDPTDRPVWERSPALVATIKAGNEASPAVTRRFTGVADRLTWRTRAIRIVPPAQGDGVRLIHFGAGERATPVDGDRDPWVPYRITKEGSWSPRRWDSSRAVWRDLQAIVVSEAGVGEAPRALQALGNLSENTDRAVPTWSLLVAGQAADKAKIEAWGQERWSVPRNLIEGHPRALNGLRRAMTGANETASSIEKCAWRLARDLLGANAAPTASELRRAVGRLPTTTAYWTILEPPFAELLRNLGRPTSEDPVPAALSTWIEALADAVLHASTYTYRTLGRDAIAIRAWARSGPRFHALAARLRRQAAAERGGTA
jgi:CRISPR system Cascade subunit CasA